MPPFPVKGTDLCSGKACFINKRYYDNPLLRFDGPDRQFLWRILLVIPIAVSNSDYSRCVAVESTCLEKFEDTIGIKCPVQPVGTCWLFQNKQTVLFAKPLARLTEVDRSGAMLQKPYQPLPVAEEPEGNSFQSEHRQE